MDSKGRPKVKTPNLRIEIPYRYLIAWYLMHCPSMTIASVCLRRLCPLCAVVGKLKLVSILHVLCSESYSKGASYQFDRCFPEIHDTSYGDKFANLVGPNEFIWLSSGVFCWLINIQPGYLIF